MIYDAPVKLSTTHALQDFSCGKKILDDWLIKYALQSQASGSTMTYVICQADAVVGFYSLSSGHINCFEATPRIQQGMGQYPIPVALLSRLAIDQRHHCQGLGKGLLKDALLRILSVADQIGIRAVLVHPLDDSARNFYLHWGFEPSPINAYQLLLLLKDARKMMGRQKQ